MDTVELTFALPPEIGALLRKGTAICDGGVIVDARSPRVLCWLDQVEPCVGIEPLRLATFGATLLIGAGGGVRLASIEARQAGFLPARPRFYVDQVSLLQQRRLSPR